MKYPATQVVHWPSGPVNACDEHAKQLHALSQFMGGYIVSTKLSEPAECQNCINEKGNQNDE